jgi:uncharacterized oxidoreductase
MNLTNNTVLITGGSSGIGLEFAKQLLALGNTVLVTGRDEGKLQNVKKMLPAVHTYKSDVTDTYAIRLLYSEITKKFPDLNFVINNAGAMRKINLHDTAISLEDITSELSTNLVAPVRIVQQFLPHLKKQKAAAILNVTSGLALAPFPIVPLYGASKAGLHSYTQSLRVQLKNTNVKVFDLIGPAANTGLNNTFAPGDIDPKTLMEADKLVSKTLEGIAGDTYEIYPGLAKMIRIMSKIAPGFLLQQFSKPVDKMLSNILVK